MSNTTPKVAATPVAAPTGPATPVGEVINSMAELERAIASGQASLVLGDASDDAKVAEVLAAQTGKDDAATFQRDPASGRLLVVELVGERKRAYIRLCRATGAKFLVRTSDAHQTFYSRGHKPRGKAASGRAATPAPTNAMKDLLK